MCECRPVVRDLPLLLSFIFILLSSWYSSSESKQFYAPYRSFTFCRCRLFINHCLDQMCNPFSQVWRKSTFDFSPSVITTRKAILRRLTWHSITAISVFEIVLGHRSSVSPQQNKPSIQGKSHIYLVLPIFRTHTEILPVRQASGEKHTIIKLWFRMIVFVMNYVFIFASTLGAVIRGNLNLAWDELS